MKVLIALDDSECSDAAFESVVERFWANDAQFRVITVVEPFYLQVPMVGMYCEPMIVAQNQYESHCGKRVQERVEELEKLFPENSVSGETLLGPIAESIIDESKSWNADLVVLGSHGRKGFSRFFLGSVAERVAGHAPCSVEIVKQKQSAPKSCQSPNVEATTEMVSPEQSVEKTMEKAAVGGKAKS